jgi:hypothetical protein
MKKRKKILSIITFCLLSMLFIVACNKDKDENNPTTPTVDLRDGFVGNFNVNDTLFNPTPNLYWYANYTMGITKSQSDSTKIIISNVNNTAQSLTATVSGTNFTVQSQAWEITGTTISGSGSVNANQLKFSLVTAGTGDQRFIYGVGQKL